MKNKIPNIIMSLVVILIAIVCGIFGNIILQEFKSMQTIVEPEEFKTTISVNENTTNKNIEILQDEDNELDNISNEYYTKQEENHNNINTNKYFYSQLNDYSKTIYQAFEQNKENMKTGTYKVELGNSFSKLLDTENGQEELGEYYQSAVEAYTYDNPDVFYLSPNKMYLNIETTTRGKSNTYYVYVNNGNETNYLIDEFSSKEQINEALEKIQQVKNSIVEKATGNTYDDIKMVHDYLVENIEYDTTISKDNIYNIYGALINGEAVCEGYARSFKYLMDNLNIPCTLVIGKGKNSQGNTENHAWNYVQLSDTWYGVDSTWDDPIGYTGGWFNQSEKYKYFLKGSNDMNIDHQPIGRFTEEGKIYNYPELSIDNY